jgi:hypothetical protein
MWDLLWALLIFAWHLGKLAFWVFVIWAYVTGRLKFVYTPKPKKIKEP